MADLTVDDLPESVLAAFGDDDVAQLALDAALAEARRYCGWPVSPVIEDDEITVDGPGGRVLRLPTMNLLEVTELIENGVALDVTKLDVSRRKGTVEKYPYGWWTGRNGAITVTMTHGFTEAEAADWRAAILSIVEHNSLPKVAAGSTMTAGPFQVAVSSAAVQPVFTEAEQAVLDMYKLLTSP